MKKQFLSFLLLTYILLARCSETVSQDSDKNEEVAQAIADSLHDTDRLAEWVAHFDSLGEKKSSLLIRQKLGTVLRNNSNFEDAIKQHDTCITMATELKDTLQLIIALNNQGTNFRRLGDLHEASTNHYAALELCDKTEGDTSFLARKNQVRTLNGLGNVLLSLGNDSVAESMFKRALKGETELGSATGQAINLANIGAIKEGRGETDSARIYYNMSMGKNRQAGNVIGISLCHQYIGHLDYIQNDNKKALDNYRKGYETGIQTGDVWHWLKPCESMAEIFLEEHKVDSARKYIDIALEAAVTIKSKNKLASAHALNARLQEMTGQYDKAVASIRLSQEYKDSMLSEQNLTHMQNLRVQYEANKRLSEVERINTEAKYERNIRKIIMWSSIIVLILILILAISQLRITKEKAKVYKATKKMDKERQEFYRGITHQLRTPLTVVIGMTEQLHKLMPEGDSTIQKEFNAVERKCKELLSLVNEMIEYNKGERKFVNVSELASNTQQNTDIILAESQVSLPDGPYILIAEDDSDVALLISSILKKEGFDFAWAKDGQEALDIICRKTPNLIITDIMMPRMDGIELIRRVREDDNKKHLPIIVVSARSEDKDRLAGLEAGAEAYLCKPFLTEELMLRVRKLLEQREILKIKFRNEIEEADKHYAKQTIQTTNTMDAAFMEKVDKFINDNIMNSKLDANILADYMNISMTTLNRKTKAITGLNTTNYIRKKRVARAKYLLLNTEMTLGEIQAVCGFESPSYFSRTFKSEYGMSPSEQRRTSN